MMLDRTPILVPKVTALTHRVRPPSLGRGHAVFIVLLPFAALQGRFLMPGDLVLCPSPGRGSFS